MPTYDYQCRSCERVIEVIHPMTSDGPSVCEQCGGTLRRILYPTGIIFKGSGFYSTDSRSSSSSKPTGTNAAPASGDGAPASSTPSTTKPESSSSSSD